MNWITSLIDLKNKEGRNKFDCGIRELDEYIKNYVSQDIKKKITACYTLSLKKEIFGYYTLSNYSIGKEDIPLEYSKKISYSEIPCALIGRLAIDKNHTEKGLGKDLLIDSLLRCVDLSNKIGIFAIVVEAKNKEAKQFYLHYGFKELETNKSKLFISIETVIKALK